MTPDRPTPLTDALVLPIQGWTDLYDAAEAYNKLLKHARQLERQSAELREALDDLQACAARALNNTMSMENRLALDLKVAIQRAAALARKQP